MITAEEARQLAGPSEEEQIEAALADAYKAIREAASRKLRGTPLHTEFWVRGGYSKTEAWECAASALRDAGFTVEFFYEEKQLVNMYTLVKW